MSNALSRTAKVDLRLTPDAKALLQSAARAADRSVSEFVLESALAKAAETLPDRRHFVLNTEQWEAFQQALDAQPRPLARMAALLAQPDPFVRPDRD